MKFKIWLEASEIKKRGIRFAVNPTADELFHYIQISMIYILKGLISEDGTIYWAINDSGREHTNLHKALFGKGIWDDGAINYDPRITIMIPPPYSSGDKEKITLYFSPFKGTPEPMLRAANKVKQEIEKINQKLKQVSA